MSSERVELGTAILMLHEPHRGHEREYNRWYERDHFYAGGTMAPWTIAAKRWVATRALKDLRYPPEGPFDGAADRGSYLAAYWIQAERLDEMQAWATAETDRLRSVGRMYEHRDLVTGSTYDYQGGALRDEDGVPPEIALDHGYPGLALTVVERADDVPIDELRSWLVDEFLPAEQRDSPIAMSLLFAPRPLPPNWPKAAPPVPGVGSRLFVMSFLETDPRACWDARFADLGRAVEASGKGRVLFVAPFIPVVPGTDTYADELW